MNYYIIQVGNNESKRVIYTNKEVADIRRVYDKLYQCKVNVAKSILPHCFYETVTFKTFTGRGLEILFLKWSCLMGIQKVKSCLQRLPQCNNAGTNFKQMMMSKAIAFITNAKSFYFKYAFGHQHPTPTKRDDDNIASSKHDDDTKQSKPLNLNKDWLAQLIDMRINDINAVHKNKNETIQMFMGVNEDELWQNVFTKRNNAVFPQHIVQNATMDDVLINDRVNLVIFKNENTQIHKAELFDTSDMSLLERMEEIGIKDIKLDCVIPFPNKQVVWNIVNHHDFCTFYGDLSAFVGKVYDVHRFLQKKPCKAALIKVVMEFLFTHYNFTINSEYEFNMLHNELVEFNIKSFRIPLNTIMDKNLLRSILEYLCIPITKNMVLHLEKKNKDCCTIVSLQPRNNIDRLIRMPYVLPKLCHIRPPINVHVDLSKTGIWGESSRIPTNNI